MELSPNEITALEIFTSNAGAYDVIMRIVKSYIDTQREGLSKNNMLLKNKSNEEIGAKFTAFITASELVDGIFREISTYRKQPDVLTSNPGK